MPVAVTVLLSVFHTLLLHYIGIGPSILVNDSSARGKIRQKPHDVGGQLESRRTHFRILPNKLI